MAFDILDSEGALDRGKFISHMEHILTDDGAKASPRAKLALITLIDEAVSAAYDEGYGDCQDIA